MQEYKVEWKIHFHETNNTKEGLQIYDQEMLDYLFDEADDETGCLLNYADAGTESVGSDRLVDAENPEHDFRWEDGKYIVKHCIIYDEAGDEVARFENFDREGWYG